MINILAKQNSLTIEKKFGFKTALGGILFIINFLISGILLYFFFNNFLFGNNMIYTSYLNENNLNYSLPFLFIFTIEKEYSDSIVILSSHHEFGYTYFNNECTSEEISFFYQNHNNSMIYYCIQNFDITINIY